MITWERAELLALLCVMFSCVFVTFPYGVPGQAWYSIVSIPDPCRLFLDLSKSIESINKFSPGDKSRSDPFDALFITSCTFRLLSLNLLLHTVAK